MNKNLPIGFGVAAALASTWLAASAQVNRSDTVTKASARIDNSAAGKTEVVVSLDIQAGWHLYANPVGSLDFEGGEVVVKVEGAKAAIQYPAGTERTDAKYGKYRVYEGKVDIRAVVDRLDGTTAPIDLIVSVQACNKNQCLPERKIRLSVP